VLVFLNLIKLLGPGYGPLRPFTDQVNEVGRQIRLEKAYHPMGLCVSLDFLWLSNLSPGKLLDDAFLGLDFQRRFGGQGSNFLANVLHDVAGKPPFRYSLDGGLSVFITAYCLGG